MNTIQSHNVRTYNSEVPPEVHDTRDAKRLKEACQQFESILWAQIWKKTKANAREFSGGENADRTRPWKQMEDLAVEMASEEISKSGGAGVWKVLYDQMIANVAAGIKPVVEEDAADA